MEEQHISEETLELYSLGRLTSPEEVEALEDHLFLCKHCLSRQEEMDEYVHAIRAAIKPAARPPKKANSKGYLPIAIAASAVLILFVFNNRAPTIVELTALRGGTELAAPAATPLSVKVDRTGLDSSAAVQWELADSALQGTLVQSEANLQLPALAKGQYWLRLRDPKSGELLREFSLAVR